MGSCIVCNRYRVGVLRLLSRLKTAQSLMIWRLQLWRQRRKVWVISWNCALDGRLTKLNRCQIGNGDHCAASNLSMPVSDVYFNIYFPVFKGFSTLFAICFTVYFCYILSFSHWCIQVCFDLARVQWSLYSLSLARQNVCKICCLQSEYVVRNSDAVEC